MAARTQVEGRNGEWTYRLESSTPFDQSLARSPLSIVRTAADPCTYSLLEVDDPYAQTVQAPMPAPLGNGRAWTAIFLHFVPAMDKRIGSDALVRMAQDDPTASSDVPSCSCHVVSGDVAIASMSLSSKEFRKMESKMNCAQDGSSFRNRLRSHASGTVDMRIARRFVGQTQHRMWKQGYFTASPPLLLSLLHLRAGPMILLLLASTA